jgi:thioesterase domain-containing protein
LLKDEIEQRMADVSGACIDAVNAHRPSAFSGRIVLIRAADLDDWVEIADLSGTCGWTSICRGGVDVIPMDCRHLDIFAEPNVSVLAEHINDLLNAMDRAVAANG